MHKTLISHEGFLDVQFTCTGNPNANIPNIRRFSKFHNPHLSNQSKFWSLPRGVSKVVVLHTGSNVYRAQEVLGLLLTVS